MKITKTTKFGDTTEPPKSMFSLYFKTFLVFIIKNIKFTVVVACIPKRNLVLGDTTKNIKEVSSDRRAEAKLGPKSDATFFFGRFLCRNGPPKKRTPKSKRKSRIITLGGISLPREPILDSVIVWACSACSACSA